MDAQQFLGEFGHIANAPEGVARLRTLIIHFAVVGKLVAGDPNRTIKAAELVLVNAEIERNKLITTGQARRTHPFPPLPDSDQIKYPRHWATTRLGGVVHLVSGQHLGPQEQNATGIGIPYFTGASDFGLIHPIVTRWTEERRAVAAHGDILIAVKGTIGKINFLNLEEAALGRQLMAIRALIVDPKFVALILRDKETYFVSRSIGIAIPGISREDILYLPVAIPPLDEQSRIVAKVDELMALCDQLERQQQDRRKVQNALRQSTLQTVASAQSPQELRSSWTRLEAILWWLFSAPEDLMDFKQAVLDLAVCGLLSRQSARVTTDDVAFIRLRKKRLSDKKKIKRDVPVIDFAGLNEMLTSIPPQWQWVRLNDIASVIRGGSPRPAGDPRFYGGSIPFLKVGDVTAAKGMFVTSYTSTIKEEGLNKTTEITSRTVLLTNSGATLGVPAICEFRTTFNDGIAAFIELADAVFDEYLYLFLKSRTQWLRDIASRGQGQPNLNTDIIRSMWFPLPPLGEQKQIVARVAKLMRFCDALELQLSGLNRVAADLSVAAVGSLTGIAVEREENEPVKAPETELLAPLRLGRTPDIRAQAPLATLLVRYNGEMSATDLWQRFGGEIDAFYDQLKTEVAHGWIQEPAVAEMREKVVGTAGA
ncbi:restriction endonuclease subunit S [Nitrospira sp. BLG_1]|uniref:restriction endonuclease subunit S n=1 Tax=Nitrospira sp. BLG_1 TaxID=3395883 RepID=UPI0039BD6A87